MSKSSQHTKDNVIESFKDIIPLSFGEEIGNAASHGAAALQDLDQRPLPAQHRH